MFWANDSKGNRIRATRGAIASCPTSGQTLIGKQGHIITNPYWSHKAGECDRWSEPETQWHINWKNLFPKNQQEVVNDEHRADVKTSKVVIELQHSSISVEEIWEREDFYKEMIWIFDCREPFKKGRIKISDISSYPNGIDWHPQHLYSQEGLDYSDLGGALKGIVWSHRRKTILRCRKPVFLHLAKGKLFNTYYWGHPKSFWANIGLGHFIDKETLFREVNEVFGTPKSSIFSMDHIPETYEQVKARTDPTVLDPDKYPF